MNRSVLFLAINAWAFVLDLVWLSLLGLVLFCHARDAPIWMEVLISVAGLYPFVQAILLHEQTSDKLATFRALLGRNRNDFREDTFAVFMGAPCGRMIVRCVLHSLGCPEKYPVLWKKYGGSFLRCENNGLVIEPFHEKVRSVTETRD